MWSDNETSLDLINVQYLVGGVAEIIRNRDLLPVTVGVYGGWGQGKSSLLRMVRERLEEDDGIVCVTFNGWLFESYDDAKSALMGSILEAIAEERSLGQKARDAMKRLVDRIDWFRTMSLAGKGALTIATGGLAGLAGLGADLLGAAGSPVGGTEASGKMSSAGGDPTIQTVRGFRDDFVELLEATEIQTLVVFIDELDRCLPTAVVETLEAIRLFLFVDGTAFVIGADEELVRHAVNLRFRDEGLQESVGGRYLEKMIQVPFRIPPMGPREMKTYMNLLFAELHTDPAAFQRLVAKLPAEATTEFGEIRFDYEHAAEMLEECPAELAESFVLTEQIGDVLASGLRGNPRQVKRFLNMLLLRMQLAQARGLDLQRRVLGKLMLLEYFHPQRFRELAAWGSVEGPCPEIRQLEEAASSEGQPLEGRLTEKEPGVGEDADGDSEAEDSEGQADKVPTPLQPELQAWLQDSQLLAWVQMAPRLTKVDLRPYLYIAREQTGPLTISRGDLSDSARNVLRKLRSDAKSFRQSGQTQLEDLSQAEAALIFENVAEDVRRAEALPSSADQPLVSLLSLIEVRSELRTDLLALFRGIPPKRLPAGVVPALENVFRDGAVLGLETVFEGWTRASSQNPRLATAAATAVKRLQKT